MTGLTLLLSWPVVAGVCALFVIAGYTSATFQASRRRRVLAMLGTGIRDLGLVIGGDAITLHDERHVMVVTSVEVLIVDIQRGTLAQHFTHDEIAGLRMAEGGEHVEFRLLLDGGAESRALHSHSIVDFARLFQLIVRHGKHLEFVPEQVP
jgi:hypothetical protein